MNPKTWLNLKRVVRFGDTDAAGVMHFYNLFRWCHEAWEESLELYGIPSDRVFPNLNRDEEDLSIAVPIVHCEANFLLPLYAGNHLDIQLLPKRIDRSSFKVETKFKRDNKEVAFGLIQHCAIDFHSRKRCALPEEIDRWLEASSLNIGVTPI